MTVVLVVVVVVEEVVGVLVVVEVLVVGCADGVLAFVLVISASPFPSPSPLTLATVVEVVVNVLCCPAVVGDFVDSLGTALLASALDEVFGLGLAMFVCFSGPTLALCNTFEAPTG